ncbi:hypothetical protein YC2023_098621 [Brassica napus]
MQDLLLSDRSLITDNLSIGLKKPSARVGDDEPTASLSLVLVLNLRRKPFKYLVSGIFSKTKSSILSFVMNPRRSIQERRIKKIEEFLCKSMSLSQSFSGDSIGLGGGSEVTTRSDYGVAFCYRHCYFCPPKATLRMAIPNTTHVDNPSKERDSEEGFQRDPPSQQLSEGFDSGLETEG